MANMSEGPLERVVHMHESHFGADKLIKTFGFACGLAACGFSRGSEPSVGLKQLSGKCADVRYALRFHGGYCGILVELENMKNLTFLGGWKDPRVKNLLFAQSVSLIVYYLHENLAFLGWTAPGLIGKRLQALGGADELGRRSCYWWGLWCVWDIVSTVLKLRELGSIEAQVEAAAKKKDAPRPALAEARQAIARSRKGLWINMVRSLCFLIPDVQWSMKSGSAWAIQPEWVLQGLSFVECVAGYYSWWYGYGTSRPVLNPVLLDKGAMRG